MLSGSTVNCGVARPQVADRGDGLHVRRVAANILNKQLLTADSGWSSNMEVGREANNPPTVETYYADLEQRRIASPLERVSCDTYSQNRVIKLTIVIIEAYHCCQLHTKLYPTFISLG
jgi:hypothetical protein